MILNKARQQDEQEAGLNILVVDDDGLNQRLLGIVLSRDNHVVTFAHDGHEAINAIMQNQFDLIFMDIQIPGMNGIEVCEHIRTKQPSHSQTPIVALTASSAHQKALQDSLNSGLINDCIYKPFETKRIEQVIESVRKGSIISKSSQNSRCNSVEAQTLETENILSLFSNDAEKYRLFFQEFMQTLPQKITKMQQNEQEQNWKSLSTLAHNLTGLAANFGAMKLSALACELDQAAGEENIAVAHGLLENIEKSIPDLQEAFTETVGYLDEMI